MCNVYMRLRIMHRQGNGGRIGDLAAKDGGALRATATVAEALAGVLNGSTIGLPA
jgi:IS5 family transposase